MDRFGLVFQDKQEKIWLGIYNEEKIIEQFLEITMPESIYSKLPLSTFVFVRVEKKGNEIGDELTLFDICTFDISHEDDLSKCNAEACVVSDHFPDISEHLFEQAFNDEQEFNDEHDKNIDKFSISLDDICLN